MPVTIEATVEMVRLIGYSFMDLYSSVSERVKRQLVLFLSDPYLFVCSPRLFYSNLLLHLQWTAASNHHI